MDGRIGELSAVLLGAVVAAAAGSAVGAHVPAMVPALGGGALAGAAVLWLTVPPRRRDPVPAAPPAADGPTTTWIRGGR